MNNIPECEIKGSSLMNNIPECEIKGSSLMNNIPECEIKSWKLKRPPTQLRPHHFWTYTSNLTTVVNSVLKFMISETTSILKS
jgi:hypothetical protein